MTTNRGLVAGIVVSVLGLGSVYVLAGDALVTLDSTDGSSAFIVRDADSNELACVQSDGKVGIGTTTPGHKLTVEGVGDSNTGVLALDVTGSASFNWASAAIAPNLDVGDQVIHMIGKAENANNTGYIGFKYQGDGSVSNLLTMGLFASDNILNITGDGKVGIGTNAPGATLDVNGVALSKYEGFSYYVSGLNVTNGAWRDLVIPTLEFNTFSGTTYNTETGQFTAPRDGYYRFTLLGYSTTPGTGSERYGLGVAVDGTLKSFSGGNYSAGDTPLSLYTCVVYLTENDVVTPRMYSHIDAVLGTAADGHQFRFQGEFVGK